MGAAPPPSRGRSPTPSARASYLAYRVGAEVAQRVPYAVGEPLVHLVGRALAYAMPRRRRQLERNLRHATRGAVEGRTLRRMVGVAFASYGRYWLELFRLPKEVREGTSLEPRLEAVGFEHIAHGAAAGKGVIIALPHLGGWDFAGAWLAGRGFPPAVVVEPVEPPELFEWFADVRRALGMEVIPLGADAGSRVLAALRAGRVVCLVCDRDLAGDGVEVELFGERTTLPAGPATLALRAGAPLVPAGVYFRPRGGHLAKIGPPVPTAREGRLRDDVTRITQDLAHRFEELIAAAPEQWHVMQPLWPEDRSPVAAADARRLPHHDPGRSEGPT